MKTYTERPQEAEDARKQREKKVSQAARNYLIHVDALSSARNPLDQAIAETNSARQDFISAVEQLGDNPYPKGSEAWNVWNTEHYFTPAREQLDKDKKKR